MRTTKLLSGLPRAVKSDLVYAWAVSAGWAVRQIRKPVSGLNSWLTVSLARLNALEADYGS